MLWEKNHLGFLINSQLLKLFFQHLIVSAELFNLRSNRLLEGIFILSSESTLTKHEWFNMTQHFGGSNSIAFAYDFLMENSRKKLRIFSVEIKLKLAEYIRHSLTPCFDEFSCYECKQCITK